MEWVEQALKVDISLELNHRERTVPVFDLQCKDKLEPNKVWKARTWSV